MTERTHNMTAGDVAAIVTDLRAGHALSLVASHHHRSKDTVRWLARSEGIETYAHAEPWSISDDARLTKLVRAGVDPSEISLEMDRARGSVRARINFLGGLASLREPDPVAAPPPPAPAVVPRGPDIWDLWSAAMQRLTDRRGADHAA